MSTAHPNGKLKTSRGRLTLADILSWLLEAKLVTADNARMLDAISRSPEYKNKHPVTVIAERGWTVAGDSSRPLNQELICEWLASKAGIDFLHIDPLKIDVAAVTAVVSHAYATRFNILPVEVNDGSIVFATADPFDQEWEEELGKILRQKLERVMATPSEIQRYLGEFYTMSRSIYGAQRDRVGPAAGVQNLEQMMELGRAGKLDANDQHIVNIVDWLLQYAFDQRASDIHLEPGRERSRVRFRIDGVLHKVYEIPSTVMSAVASRIKILGRMDVAEKRRPQDGRLKTRNPDAKEVELRLSTMPVAFGEKLVMRIFNPEVLVKSTEALGFSPREAELWRGMIRSPNGIVLVTGPTGSGKTTTLYSSLMQLATPEINLCTIEDPIELVVPEFNQMQVQHNINLDFASGVRTLLRQDPDIIMVGEIRDLETAEIATQAALTGHLVLSTLHTNDAPSAITRMLELGVPAYLINGTVLGVTAQRLLRALCPHCKRREPLASETWLELVRPWKSQQPDAHFVPVGCPECRQTGYMGRDGVYEICRMTPAMRRLITDQADSAQVRNQAIREGMLPLRLGGARKVAAGTTSIEEVWRVTPPASAE